MPEKTTTTVPAMYDLPLTGAVFVKACGGSTHPDGESCVMLARVGENVWALGDSKRPEAEPLRFTTDELLAAGIEPGRFGLSA
ncbi:DUF397 domain-containing protein [Streptomyces sp. WAC 00631]|uniref:DUF397 domain-containing protein n=1 Tax=unclassified Streptomyces TaxID=2593676 RepID=UPI000F775C0A|nr:MULTISPECIES: DUF397 domain-containing protein [unclassified Streptomyces]MCC5033217.1 DUF397 domain-containing protein [Streptomyces sp. WAC 00631]MCC9741291.1 DUF397 domain-containing protein [Streptomyces sp. MNU89]